MPTRLGAIAAVIAVWPAAALGHHSFGMYDTDRPIILAATVVAYTWSQPHIWLEVMAPAPEGAVVRWKLECASPNLLGREGWSADSFKPGDRVTLAVFPRRDGKAGGAVRQATLADGKALPGYTFFDTSPNEGRR